MFNVPHFVNGRSEKCGLRNGLTNLAGKSSVAFACFFLGKLICSTICAVGTVLQSNNYTWTPH